MRPLWSERKEGPRAPLQKGTGWGQEEKGRKGEVHLALGEPYNWIKGAKKKAGAKHLGDGLSSETVSD